uniref:Uncharacterized protein n=1 Tax=Brassica oleracea var. oleracea TaxID=109376 RepID=A0A0D3DJ08_BRAOL
MIHGLLLQDSTREAEFREVLKDPLQPSTSGISAAGDLAGVGLVVDLTDFGEEAVVHVDDEPVIGEFHQDPDSDSSESISSEYSDGIPRKIGVSSESPRSASCSLSASRSLSVRAPPLSPPERLLSRLTLSAASPPHAERRLSASSPFQSLIMSTDDQTRPRQRRGRGGTGSQSRDSTHIHIQDFASPHSSYHTSPSLAPAAAPLAPAAAPPGPPGVMSVAEDKFLGIYQRTHSSEFSEGSVLRNFPMKIPRNIPRNIPTDTFLGIFRELRSSEFPDEDSEEHFVGTSEDCNIGKSIEISRGSSPSVYSEDLSDELVVLGGSSEIQFLEISSEISKEFSRKNKFPRSYFRGLVSSVCR